MFELRERKALSLRQLNALHHLSPTALSQGLRRKSERALKIVAAVLEIPPREIWPSQSR